MYTKLNVFGCGLGLALGLSSMGCTEVGGGESATDESVSGLTMGTPFYDGSTSCTISGLSMHCCPDGTAMVGAHLGKDVFKCAGLATLTSFRFIDFNTVRNNMHACPQGSVMVGLRADQNKLLCQHTNPPTLLSREFVDFGTHDSFVMHVCASTSFGTAAMAGIHVNNDVFTCDS